MSVIRLGNPAVPVKITGGGTYLAKLEHVWQAARRYAKQHRYDGIETYSVADISPLWAYVAAWFTRLEIPFKLPVDVYQLDDRRTTWVAEWTNRLN